MSVAKPIRHDCGSSKEKVRRPAPTAISDGLGLKKASQSSSGDISDVGRTVSSPRPDPHLVTTFVRQESPEPLDDFAISKLREFFELLDGWERERSMGRRDGEND